MKIDVSGFRLYRSQEADKSHEYHSVLFPTELQARRCYVYHNSTWYEADCLPTGDDTTFWAVHLPYSRCNRPNGHVTLAQRELRMSSKGHPALHFAWVENHPYQNIDAIPLPPEVRDIIFHGLSDDRTQRLVVVRSRYYMGDTRFYHAYLGNSYRRQISGLYVPADMIRSAEDYPASWIFTTASGDELRVPVSQMHDATYGDTKFSYTASQIDFEEVDGSLRFSLIEA